MNATLRHFSVRMWLTAFSGGLVCISFLPWWQQILGIGWLVVPAAVIIAGCFGGIGWMMNRIGMGLLKRQVNEAATWERAGMMSEAEASYGKAMATFDSFWLSPLLRQGRFQWFSGLLARFYLGQRSDRAFARSQISSHLTQFPRDKVMAEPWLEHLLAYERHLPEEHEAVVRVGHHLSGHRRIQRLLMQFYMANGRVDFEAMQTYRMVWKNQQPLPPETLAHLARLLLNDHILNHWALQVYLKAYESGYKAALEGVAAAVKWLPATEESSPYRTAAKEILATLDPQQLGPLDSRFQSPQLHPSSLGTPQDQARTRPAVKISLTSLLAGGIRSIQQGCGSVWKTVSSKSARRVFPGIAIALTIVLAVVAGWRYFSRPVQEPAVKPAAVTKAIVITDPFTIQVAAYLKAEDAQQIVDQLIGKELDAFWTEATSANRTWYQVKVSHFASRQAAQKYGQELKSKGLIDDFYVANYEHARRNTSRKAPNR